MQYFTCSKCFFSICAMVRTQLMIIQNDYILVQPCHVFLPCYKKITILLNWKIQLQCNMCIFHVIPIWKAKMPTGKQLYILRLIFPNFWRAGHTISTLRSNSDISTKPLNYVKVHLFIFQLTEDVRLTYSWLSTLNK